MSSKKKICLTLEETARIRWHIREYSAAAVAKIVEKNELPASLIERLIARYAINERLAVYSEKYRAEVLRYALWVFRARYTTLLTRRARRSAKKVAPEPVEEKKAVQKPVEEKKAVQKPVEEKKAVQKPVEAKKVAPVEEIQILGPVERKIRPVSLRGAEYNVWVFRDTYDHTVYKKLLAYSETAATKYLNSNLCWIKTGFL